jgi:hypothetical protein
VPWKRKGDQSTLGGKYPALEPHLRELTTLRGQIARKTLAGPSVEGIEAYRTRLADWNIARERIEGDLARQIPEMNVGQTMRSADHRAVALALTIVPVARRCDS